MCFIVDVYLTRPQSIFLNDYWQCLSSAAAVLLENQSHSVDVSSARALVGLRLCSQGRPLAPVNTRNLLPAPAATPPFSRALNGTSRWCRTCQTVENPWRLEFKS